MKHMMVILLNIGLISCAPAVHLNTSSPADALLGAQASEQNGYLTFRIINISGHDIMTQSNYCFDQPKWEAKYMNGIIYGPVQRRYTGIDGTSITESCLDILWTKLLVPGEEIVIKRKLDLPPGSYILQSWIGPLKSENTGGTRLEAPAITVNIP
ncbi:hypothetical protein Q0M94_23620 (plasmid) [Deinococcus radiomollis]|uniref:hypothetical protein n=1 Tax=Deinococcus radiomollis TaxID=468916 RepID=UPI0038926D08